MGNEIILGPPDSKGTMEIKSPLNGATRITPVTFL